MGREKDKESAGILMNMFMKVNEKTNKYTVTER